MNRHTYELKLSDKWARYSPAPQEEQAEEYAKIYDILSETDVNVDGIERLATMFVRASHEVRDAVAIVVASLLHGRFVRIRSGEKIQLWHNALPQSIDSDFFAILWLFLYADSQSSIQRHSEGLFFGNAIEKIARTAKNILGHPPKVDLERFNLEAFHYAIFTGIWDLVFRRVSTGWKAENESTSWQLDRYSVLKPGTTLVSGILGQVVPTNGADPLKRLSSVFPVSAEQVVEWKKRFGVRVGDKDKAQHTTAEVPARPEDLELRKLCRERKLEIPTIPSPLYAGTLPGIEVVRDADGSPGWYALVHKGRANYDWEAYVNEADAQSVHCETLKIFARQWKLVKAGRETRGVTRTFQVEP